jgi:transcriptional regulator with PAS, ATPase and Fis domain
MGKDVPSTQAHRAPARPPAARRRPVLVGVFPAQRALPLPDSGAVVGRAWLAEAGLPDTEVSSAQLRFDRSGGTLRVADAGSRNGSWLDGTRLPPDELVPVTDGAVLRIGRTLLVHRAALEGALEPAPPLGDLVAPFGAREAAAALAALPATGPRNVLVEGETGVGKELLARAVAAALGRATPFGAVNVAALARGVFESQLFGHVAGAFSDARQPAPGLAVSNEGGTLFLDEIGELPLDLQAKLLRLLENREVLPVGAHRAVPVDLLVVAATNRRLEDLVLRGEFRRDLLARLAAARIVIAPLRERRDDVMALTLELAARAGIALSPATIEVEAAERLLLESWPGNARDLSAALAAVARIDPAPGLRAWALDEVLGPRATTEAPLTRATAEAAVAQTGGNVTAAAQALGVSRGKLLRVRKGDKKR